jgi:anti-sigma B factor antagonist
MDLTASKHGVVTLVGITGNLDTLTAETVSNFLTKQIQEGASQLVADLSKVDYLSSAGLRVLISTLKETRRQGGDLRLAAAQKNVQQVLEFSGFSTILKIYPEVEAALASFGS